MDEQTRKKVMIGVLAALALGAGVYYFVLRDSGSTAKGTTQTASVRREKAQVDPRAAKDSGRKERPQEEVRGEEEEATERRVREESDDEDTGRRKKRTDEGKVKKKKLEPAA